MTVSTKQKLVCLGGEKKRRKKIRLAMWDFFCAFIELWVALLLGKLHSVLRCQNSNPNEKKVDLSEFI